MKIKCLDNEYGEFTVGKIYKVIGKIPHFYVINDDNGKQALALMDNFKIVVDNFDNCMIE